MIEIKLLRQPFDRTAAGSEFAVFSVTDDEFLLLSIKSVRPNESNKIETDGVLMKNDGGAGGCTGTLVPTTTLNFRGDV